MTNLILIIEDEDTGETYEVLEDLEGWDLTLPHAQAAFAKEVGTVVKKIMDEKEEKNYEFYHRTE